MRYVFKKYDNIGKNRTFVRICKNFLKMCILEFVKRHNSVEICRIRK